MLRVWVEYIGNAISLCAVVCFIIYGYKFYLYLKK